MVDFSKGTFFSQRYWHVQRTLLGRPVWQTQEGSAMCAECIHQYAMHTGMHTVRCLSSVWGLHRPVGRTHCSPCWLDTDAHHTDQTLDLMPNGVERRGWIGGLVDATFKCGGQVHACMHDGHSKQTSQHAAAPQQQLHALARCIPTHRRRSRGGGRTQPANRKATDPKFP